MLRPEDAGGQHHHHQHQQSNNSRQTNQQRATAAAADDHDGGESIPPGARSPHPYRRQSLDIHDRIFVTNLAARERQQPQQQQQQAAYVQSNTSSSVAGAGAGTAAAARESTPRRRGAARKDSGVSSSDYSRGDGGSGRDNTATETRWALTTSPSDSGTEADDERTYLRGLPAAPGRPRKGLRGQSGAVTPSDFDGVKEKYLQGTSGGGGGDDKGYFGRHSRPAAESKAGRGGEEKTDTAAGETQYMRKWRAELLRRVLEHLFLCALTHWCLEGSTEKLLGWPWTYSKDKVVWDATEKAKWLVLWILGSYMVYAFWIWTKYVRAAWRIGKIPLGQVPSPSDPGSTLYPLLVPIAVASAGAPTSNRPSILLLNLVLSLCTYPVTSGSAALANIEYATLMFFSLPHIGGTSYAKMPFFEDLTFILPFHASLVSTIKYFCASSLLSAESQLLSVGLINVSFFASSPQSVILYSLLWMGGLFMLVGCRHVMKWSTMLARIPGWRFRSPRHAQAPASSNDLPSTAIGTLLKTSSFFTTGQNRDSSDDREWVNKDDARSTKRLKSLAEMKKNEPKDSTRGDPDGFTAVNNVNGTKLTSSGPRRRHTVPEIIKTDADATASAAAQKHQKRNRRTRMKPFLWILRLTRIQAFIFKWILRLTRTQASVVKWVFAFYVYGFALAAILLPIREYIQRNALLGHEPVGWALSYLFGNISYFRLQVILSDLDFWIPLPPRISLTGQEEFSFEYIRSQIFGAANTRLIICAWCVLNLVAGLVAVFHLRQVVEVDTRRKVFHGMMVAMFLPTIIIDPCFVALALTLMLAIFLLLDLFRAAQLPPISRPLTNFLAPYVDGRDHKGPIVISPIFLLIGCAIPLWLSLASLKRTPQPPDAEHDPWAGWEVEGRELSMVAGVICVGMGDAAASLIGRRYGRRRWIWSGGKSLEGSAAFVVAVAIGLLAAKAWITLGRWSDELASPSQKDATEPVGVALTVCKTIIAGVGASFTEAVLTGGNDNVIVPVVLWLLVRCLKI